MRLIAALCFLAVTALASDVVTLTSRNFEQETQASTGATTGDWLLKFYAPWCGHCKTLAPTYEKVATNLKGRVNVGKIDVTANRDLGTRFGIQGFPTLKLLHHGQVFSYSGRRTAAEIEHFATEGYALAQPAEVPKPVGMFGEVTLAFKQAWAKSQRDFASGNYFTPDVVLVTMPFFFVLILVAMIAIPLSDPTLNAPPRRAPQAAPAGDDAEDEADEEPAGDEKNKKSD